MDTNRIQTPLLLTSYLFEYPSETWWESVPTHAAAVADAEPKKIEDLSKAASVGPGETVTFPNGKWRNVSGQWLSPHTQGPSSFWQGWMKLDGKKIDLQALKPWGVGFKVNAGDQCRHDGKAWRALQEHTTVSEWAPGMAPLLWQLVE